MVAALDTETGEKILVTHTEYYEDFARHEDYSAEVLIAPGQFRKFVWTV